MEGLFSLFGRKTIFLFVYASNLFLSFHYFTTVYVNSSFLSQSLSRGEVSVLYVLASLANLIILLSISSFLNRFGTYRLLLAFSLIDLVSVLGLAVFNEILPLIVPFFFLHQALVPLILFCLDLFLENGTKDEKFTGELRGLFLTVTNTALVLSPLLVALTVKDGNFSKIYLLSGLFLIPVILIAVAKFRSLLDPEYPSLNIRRGWLSFKKDRNLSIVLFCNFILQFFYAWMVVYTPIYLSSVIGLSWQEIGILFTIMLVPFLLLEFPAGALADRKIGEKEMMMGGFIMMAISTITLSLIEGDNLYLWATVLLLTRTGASLVEITTESYFFKKTDGLDADLVGIFRGTRPLSYVIAPIVGVAALSLLPFQYIFVVLGVILALGSIAVLPLLDTR